MTQDEIIRMAREAKFPTLTEYGYESLERFAALVAANEREKQAAQEPVACDWENPCDKLKVTQESLREHMARIKELEALLEAHRSIANVFIKTEQEPVAVISESAIGLVKLHSNGVSLPFGTPLYAAPVRTKDLTDKFELARIARETGLAVVKCTQSDGWDRIETEADFSKLPDFARAVIAADREKNK